MGLFSYMLIAVFALSNGWAVSDKKIEQTNNVFAFNDGACVGFWISKHGHAITTPNCSNVCTECDIILDKENFTLIQTKTVSNSCFPLNPYQVRTNQTLYIVSESLVPASLVEVWAGGNWVKGFFTKWYPAYKYVNPYTHIISGPVEHDGLPVITTDGMLEGVALRLSEHFTKVLRSDHIFSSTMESLGETAWSAFDCE